MKNTPDHWLTCKLPDVVYFQEGPGLRKYQYRDQGIPFLNIRTLINEQVNLGLCKCLDESEVKLKYQHFLLEEGDLVCSTSGTLGKIAVIKKTDLPLMLNTSVIRFRTHDESVVLQRFIKAYLKSNNFLTQALKASTGSAQVNVGPSHLKDFDFSVPPIDEQKRIADKLDAVLARVDACRDRLDRIPAILKRFRQSVLAAAASGNLTQEWREQNPYIGKDNPAQLLIKQIQHRKLAWIHENNQHNEVSRVKKRVQTFLDDCGIETTDLPDSWVWAQLEDVVLMVVDCHNKTAPYENSGIAFVRTTNIRDGRFIWEDLRYVSEGTFQYWSKRCLPEPGDVVFTREAPMGEAAIIPAGTKICLGQRTMLFRPIEDQLSAKFLLIALMDPYFRERSENIAVGTGVKHYRVGDVSELKVPVPPVEEQTEVVRRVESLFAYADRLEARYNAARTQVEKLTPTLLAKAFRGELVQQDPNDEPASELLERIAAGKPRQTKTKVTKKAS